MIHEVDFRVPGRQHSKEKPSVNHCMHKAKINACKAAATLYEALRVQVGGILASMFHVAIQFKGVVFEIAQFRLRRRSLAPIPDRTPSTPNSATHCIVLSLQ